MKDRTKLQRLLLSALMALLVAVALPAQGLQVEKSPGDTIVLAWNFAPADEASIDGFAVQAAAQVDGPYADVKTVPKTVRTATTIVGNTPTFYSVLSYKATAAAGTPRIESRRSNPVAVAIVLKPPLGLGGS